MMMEELKLAAGFRFHPTDEELVEHYLCRKCAGQNMFVNDVIGEIDLYKYDPWQLPNMALHGEKEWYFFSPRDRKYPNGSRPNRAAGSGYWKATGADKPVGRPKTLGIKKALVFYAGKAPKGIKTNWIMHEYRLANVDRTSKSNNKRLDEWVLCRIYNKKGRLDEEYVSHEKSEAIQLMHNATNSSSGSDHVTSSCDKEVESVPNWEELQTFVDCQLNCIIDFDSQLPYDNFNSFLFMHNTF